MTSYIILARQWYQSEFREKIEHRAIMKTIRDEGKLAPRFVFMTALSAAIAILGLLLSSPAVVIGAMLLSPLMSPIVALGFALCVLNLGLVRQSLVSLATGTVIAILITAAIVYCSPLTDATPEIIARTQPNFFDLLIAIFSGMAGGYATIRHKGGNIVGVAIATALMPPLAVVGYGLATMQWGIARGAGLLFMTNLLAIALTVTVMAKWYGFARRKEMEHTIWQTALILVVFAALSFPLGFALKDIASKGYTTKIAQAEVKNRAESRHARIDHFSIVFPKNQPAQAYAMVLTRHYLPGLDQEVQQALDKKLQNRVTLEIDQLLVADATTSTQEQSLAEARNPVAAPASDSGISPGTYMVAYAKDSLLLPVKAQRIDPDTKHVVMVIDRTMKPSAIPQAEKALRDHFPGWSAELVRVPDAETAIPGEK